jgi:hypothetical protein
MQAAFRESTLKYRNTIARVLMLTILLPPFFCGHDLEGYWGKQVDGERIRGVEIEKERWSHAADHLCARDPGQGDEKL